MKVLTPSVYKHYCQHKQIVKLSTLYTNVNIKLNKSLKANVAQQYIWLWKSCINNCFFGILLECQILFMVSFKVNFNRKRQNKKIKIVANKNCKKKSYFNEKSFIKKIALLYCFLIASDKENVGASSKNINFHTFPSLTRRGGSK